MLSSPPRRALLLLLLPPLLPQSPLLPHYYAALLLPQAPPRPTPGKTPPPLPRTSVRGGGTPPLLFPPPAPLRMMPRPRVSRLVPRAPASRRCDRRLSNSLRASTLRSVGGRRIGGERHSSANRRGWALAARRGKAFRAMTRTLLSSSALRTRLPLRHVGEDPLHSGQVDVPLDAHGAQADGLRPPSPGCSFAGGRPSVGGGVVTLCGGSTREKRKATTCCSPRSRNYGSAPVRTSFRQGLAGSRTRAPSAAAARAGQRGRRLGGWRVTPSRSDESVRKNAARLRLDERDDAGEALLLEVVLKRVRSERRLAPSQDRKQVPNLVLPCGRGQGRRQSQGREACDATTAGGHASPAPSRNPSRGPSISQRALISQSCVGAGRRRRESSLRVRLTRRTRWIQAAATNARSGSPNEIR